MTTTAHKMKELMYKFFKSSSAERKLPLGETEDSSILISLSVIYSYFFAMGERLLLREAVENVVKNI